MEKSMNHNPIYWKPFLLKDLFDIRMGDKLNSRFRWRVSRILFHSKRAILYCTECGYNGTKIRRDDIFS